MVKKYNTGFSLVAIIARATQNFWEIYLFNIYMITSETSCHKNEWKSNIMTLFSDWIWFPAAF